MTPTPETVNRVLGLFSAGLNLDVPSVETDLIAAGLLDSLLLVEIILHIEQEFGVDVPLKELDVETFRSVLSIAAYVESLRDGDATGKIEEA